MVWKKTQGLRKKLKFCGFKTQWTGRDHYYNRCQKCVKTPCFHSAQSVTNFFSFLFSTVSRWSNADSSKVPLIGILITIAVGCAVIALFTTVCLVVVCKRKVGMQKSVYSFYSGLTVIFLWLVLAFFEWSLTTLIFFKEVWKSSQKSIQFLTCWIGLE